MAGQATLRTIIAYKAIKGAIELALGLALGIALWLGEGQRLHQLALTLREDVTARVAVETAELFLRLSTPGHLAISALAVGLDGVVGGVEALLLHHRKRWAVWVVVIASSVLIPWEVFELISHFRVLRLVLLILNVAVVVYLGRQASRHLGAAPQVNRPIEGA